MKVMKPWLELQKDILKELTIAEIKLSNITPVRIGGYNARPYSDALGLVEKVRTQAIKGIWRWWARAILAGALLSTQGMLPSTISKMNDEVSNLLGSTKESSHFFVQVEEMDYSFIALNKLQFIPRIKLLSMSSEQNKEERYYHPLRFKLTLGTRRRLTEPDKNTAMFALSSLLISLIFSGIGSITTRGFGKFRISLNSKNQLLSNEINNLDKLLKELYSQNKEDDVTKKLEEIILTSLNYAINYKSPGSTVRKNVEINELPPFPALLLKCQPRIFKLETIYISHKDPLQVLEVIGKSTLKYEWKRRMRQYLSSRSSGKSFHTWILGLPRYQELLYEKNGEKVKKLTGYIANDKKEIRRVSPIGFTIIQLSNKNLAIVLYGFLTNEYPRLLKGYKNLVLKHIGIRTTKSSLRGVIGKIVKINETKVYDDVVLTIKDNKLEDIYQKCFDTAWRFIKEIVRGYCK